MTASGGHVAGTDPVERGDPLPALLDGLDQGGVVRARGWTPPEDERVAAVVGLRAGGWKRVDGRGWKYCGSGLPLASVNSWQIRLDPTTLPL